MERYPDLDLIRECSEEIEKNEVNHQNYSLNTLY